MEWNTDTSKCEHDKQYLVYYNGNCPNHSLQTYVRYDDCDTEFTGEGFYYLDINDDFWKRCFKQPTHFRELDVPVV